MNSKLLYTAITLQRTLHAGVADFEEHLEVTEARFCSLEIGVRNSNLASFSSGAFGVQQTDDVGGTAKEAFVLAHRSLVGRNALTDTMTSVDGLVYHDHLVLPALRLKCLQLTKLLQLTCMSIQHVVSKPEGDRRGSNVSMVHSSRNSLDSPIESETTRQENNRRSWLKCFQKTELSPLN